jgi:SAM-dependent methyltransferase|tara:strand:- start:180 stop:866 length:687 start_codon:yes stop_codon:yes gene_type:complete
MNKKILGQLLAHSQNDLDKITQPYILETFGVEVKRCNSIEEYSIAIDDACLHKYFSKYWQNDMKKWKYSGLALIDEVNNLKPRAVLDVGCGYNEFKGKIDNLIGIDPYNDLADFETGTLDYKTDEKFDVILCLGSVNFGTRDKIIAEIKKCVELLADGGTMFFRVNPGVQHDKPEAKWIEFFAWNVPFIIELSNMFNLDILDIRDDTNQRKYFIFRKKLTNLEKESKI